MVLPPRATRASATPKSPPPAPSSRSARASSQAGPDSSQPTSTSTIPRSTTTPTARASTTSGTSSSRLGWNSSTAVPSSSSGSGAAPKARLASTRPSTATPASNTAGSIAPSRTLSSSTRANSLATAPVRSSLATGSRKPSLAASTGAGRAAAGLAPPSQLKRAVRDSTAPTLGGEMLPPATPSRRQTVDRTGLDGYDSTREPIKAYLRIKPPLEGSQTPGENYLQVVNETDVLMTPPADHRLGPSASSMFLSSNSLGLPPLDGAPAPAMQQGTLFKFTSVAPSATSALPDAQQAFFRDTTFPLVKSFLKGENCLLFAYGTTGSGKTWTVQGGREPGEEGLLPRVLDTVWRSLQAQQPNKQQSKLATPPMQSTPKQGAQGLGVKGLPAGDSLGADAELVAIEDGFDYSVSVSYAEIYNEKIYDLLEGPNPTVTPSTSSAASTGGSSMFGGISRLVRNLSTVKRSALSLKADKAGTPGAKYVAGMQEKQVSSAQEARAILEKGQMNRRVYSTLANRASSRSHSVFTIKLNKAPRGLRDDEREKQTVVSRLSIVDLAGSERVVNTHTTGERLKEAGNINKSLMVLGQCMDTLRKNQEQRESKSTKKPAIVPFRHSKLTELFQSFFVGDGQAVMIVNVDPWQTSFDENHHVMKFAAVAKAVTTTKNDRPAPATPALQPAPRMVRLSIVEGGEEEDVIYEEVDQEYDDDEYGAEEDEEPEDEFVNALLDELSAMRTALVEAQMQTVLAVSSAKQLIIAEYEARMAEMELAHARRLREEQDEAELRFDAKLDILRRLEESTKHTRRPRLSEASSYDDSDDEQEDDEEDDGEQDTGEETSFAESEGASVDGPSEDEVSRMLTSPAKAELAANGSPLAHKLAKMNIIEDASMQEVMAEEEGDDEGEVTETELEQSTATTDADVSLASSAAADASEANESSIALETDEADNPSEDEDQDEVVLAVSSPAVPKSGKKPKRKLGGNKVREVEEIEQAGLQSPLGKKR